MFAVIKVSGENYINGTAVRTQCGAAVKTTDKAYDLLRRMRAQQQLGSSNSFVIEKI